MWCSDPEVVYSLLPKLYVRQTGNKRGESRVPVLLWRQTSADAPALPGDVCNSLSAAELTAMLTQRLGHTGLAETVWQSRRVQ